MTRPSVPSVRIRRKHVPPYEVMDKLGDEYGPVQWAPRYAPASELVSTILSQHTSDVNSQRAFGSLMERFGSLDAVADAPIEEIEESIRMGGLAKIKAPRIKEVLQKVREMVGSYDLSFLAEMPLAGGQGLAHGPAWNRAQDGGDHTLLLARHAGHAGGHAHLPRLEEAGPDRPQGQR